MNPRMTIQEASAHDDVEAIERGLTDHAMRAGVEPRNYRDLSVLLRDDEGRLVAGLVGATVWGWLHIRLLWVADRERGKGYGAQLLRAAEREAEQRGCHHALVDTFDFQARDFYERLGYMVFGTLDDFPRGHSRIYLQKQLAR